jgi:UDP:flavonoid glycosyltransferase YjiC (YdhE family)
VIVFLVSPFASHVFGALGVARRLQARGFRVEFWGGAGSRNLVRGQKFEHFELQDVWYCHERLLRAEKNCGTLRGLRARKSDTESALERFERSLDAQLARRTPDLVILDSMVVAYFPLLRKRGLKCVLLQDKPLPISDALVPPPTSSLIPWDTPWGRASVRARWMCETVGAAGRWIGSRALGALGAYTSEHLLECIERRVGSGAGNTRARRWVGYDLHFEGMDEWILGNASQDFPRRSPLPAHVRYIGPCVDFERVQMSAAHSRPRDARHLIYVSMGTTVPRWNSDLPLLRRLMEAFGGVPGVQVAIAAGNARARAVLRTSFENIHVAAYLPQIVMLQMADLAVVHCGANAFRECIATATPMLAFPRDYDQPGNAARAVHLGIGLRGSRRLDTARAIREKALRLLSDAHCSTRVRELQIAAKQSEPALLDDALRDARLSADGDQLVGLQFA